MNLILFNTRTTSEVIVRNRQQAQVYSFCERGRCVMRSPGYWYDVAASSLEFLELCTMYSVTNKL